MTARRIPRLAMPLRERRSGARTGSPFAERLLHELGAHPSFADAVLGDLAEERARREREESSVSAHWWYVREAFRSAPHLVWNAVRHGGWRGRARAAAVLLGVALAPTAALIALLLRDGPPVRLVVEGQHGAALSDGLVLNSRRPVQLEMRVLDAKGRVLPSTDVRYHWTSGLPLSVTPSGVVTCKHPGDATVRASLGAVETSVLLRCRPVKEVKAQMGMNFVVGDSGKDLRFAALAPNGWPVDLLAGEVHVLDSTVATLKGMRIRPVAPGRTTVIVRIGDGESWTGVSVYEPVRTLEGLRRDQRLVVVPVRLARGDTIRWPLPMGLFFLHYNRTSAAQPIPTFAVDGLIMCMPDFGPTVDDTWCLVRAPGASVRISHPVTVAGEIVGSLALTRQDDPEPEPVTSSTEAIHASSRVATADLRPVSVHPPSRGDGRRAVAVAARGAAGERSGAAGTERDSRHAGGRGAPRVARRVQQR
jgi:hypothetical protein